MHNLPGTLTSFVSAVQYGVQLSDTGVVIPAYNAETTISAIVHELIQYGFRRENIIVVDDGSRDRTRTVLNGLGISIVGHKKNRGKGAALKSGFDAARTKGLKDIVTLDADGQHRVSEIEQLLRVRPHHDIVIGQRHDVRTMPFIRNLVNRITSLVVSLLSGTYVPDVQCGFRYIRLRILDTIRLHTNNYQTESEMVIKAIRRNYRIGFIPITTVYPGTRSYIHPLIDTLRFVIMAVGFLWR